MESIFEFGLNATRWLQMTFPHLSGFFNFFTFLGDEEFYLIALPLIYWCLNKELGRHLSYVFMLSSAVNLLFKPVLRGPRPFWLDNSVSLSVETNYGVPSWHAQMATTVYLMIAYWAHKRWMWLLAILLMLLMFTSRVYLGVHFVHDIVVGFLLGLLIVLGYIFWDRRWVSRFRRRILGFRLLVALLAPLVIAILYVGLLLLLGEPNRAVAWADFIDLAELNGIEEITTAVATLLGTGVGLVLEKSRVRFRVEGATWQRVLRYALGIVVAVAIWAGLRAIFPEEPLLLAVPLRFVRYTLLALWITYYAPLTFVWLGLASADPEPEIDLSLSER